MLNWSNMSTPIFTFARRPFAASAQFGSYGLGLSTTPFSWWPLVRVPWATRIGWEFAHAGFRKHQGLLLGVGPLRLDVWWGPA